MRRANADSSAFVLAEISDTYAESASEAGGVAAEAAGQTKAVMPSVPNSARRKESSFMKTSTTDLNSHHREWRVV